jgi:putative ABC transport system permease protein
LGAAVNGRWRRLHIVGIALSPEFVVEAAGTFDDRHRFGYLWAARALFETAFQMEGAFNVVAVRLAPGADPRAVSSELDRVLKPYGSAGALPRAELPMMRAIDSEFGQLQTNASVFSSFFLIVSAFLLNVVLSRLVAAQREDLGALKAFGYTNGEVARHYMGFALAAVIAGALIGVPGGIWMERVFVDLYRQFFRFPVLEARMDIATAGPAIAIAALCALLGAVGAVRRAAALSPADALRPESPRRARRLGLERLGLGHFVSPSVRLVLRSLERRPLRTLSSAVGVGLAIAVLIGGRVPSDVFARVEAVQFRVTAREDFVVHFTDPKPARAAIELLSITGVTAVEPFRIAPARLVARAVSRTSTITGLTVGAALHRLVDVTGAVHAVPRGGALLSGGLARRLGLRTGDTVHAELIEQGITRPVVVAGTIDEMLGEGAYMEIDALRGLLREGSTVSGAYIAVDGRYRDAVSNAFKRYPGIAVAVSRASTVRTFREQTSETVLLVMGLVTFSAVLISTGVVYNNARVAISERGRELGSLRVLGYTRGEITRMLVGEQALITLIGIPLGLVFGRIVGLALARGFTSDAYHFPFATSWASQGMGVVLVVVTTALASIVTWHMVNALDIVAALKTRE